MLCETRNFSLVVMGKMNVYWGVDQRGCWASVDLGAQFLCWVCVEARKGTCEHGQKHQLCFFVGVGFIMFIMKAFDVGFFSRVKTEHATPKKNFFFL